MKKQTNVIDATQYLEVVRYDKNGEILSRVEKKAVSKNGSGFVISYTEKVCDFLAKTDKASVVRIFLFIAHHQQYGQDGCFGYRCSHKYLEQVLHLNRKTVYEALAELKKAFLVNEARIGFMPRAWRPREESKRGAGDSQQQRTTAAGAGGHDCPIVLTFQTA